MTETTDAGEKQPPTRREAMLAKLADLTARLMGYTA